MRDGSGKRKLNPNPSQPDIGSKNKTPNMVFFFFFCGTASNPARNRLSPDGSPDWVGLCRVDPDILGTQSKLRK